MNNDNTQHSTGPNLAAIAAGAIAGTAWSASFGLLSGIMLAIPLSAIAMVLAMSAGATLETVDSHPLLILVMCAGSPFVYGVAFIGPGLLVRLRWPAFGGAWAGVGALFAVSMTALYWIGSFATLAAG